MDLVIKALADPSRRVLLDRLMHRNGQTLTELCREVAMTRQAVTKHLGILKRADLVIPLWRGRQKLHFINPVPVYRIREGWLAKFEEVRISAYLDLKKALEENGPQIL